MALGGQKVFVVGGTSGIGLAVAHAALDHGADVAIASRSADRRAAAAGALGAAARAIEIDVTNDESVAQACETAGPVDHVVVTAPGAAVGKVADLPTDTAQAAFNAKFWGAFRVAKYARINEGGTLTLLSGQMARRPRPGLVLGGCVDAAVEALARGLAVDLAPIRVNAVSPGLIDTPLHARLGDEQRTAAYRAASEHLPVHRVGRPDEIAAMILAIIDNGFVTGTTVQVDGGAMVV